MRALLCKYRAVREQRYQGESSSNSQLICSHLDSCQEVRITLVERSERMVADPEITVYATLRASCWQKGNFPIGDHSLATQENSFATIESAWMALSEAAIGDGYHGLERIHAAMSDTIEVHLTLTSDKPNSMNFEDTYSGLEDVWYKFEADEKGNVTLLANADGFEHLARYFLKMARTEKRHGYHAHHTLEFGKPPEGPELTNTFYERP